MDAIYLLLLSASLALWPSAVSADATTTSSASATGTAPAFPTMSGQDGVGVPAGGVGSQDTGSAGGASGSDQGSFSISTGAIVGISVAVGVVVIAIVTLWALWFLAKRRNWNIRESIRRASRRLTGRRDTGTASRSSRANRRGTVMLKSPPANGPHTPRTANNVDLEKGRYKKPNPGWLAEEKERSRSSSREDEKSRQSGK